MKNLKQAFLITAVAGFIILGLFIWYKQYSFRSLQIYTLPTRTEDNLEKNTIEADGKKYIYCESRYYTPQWFKCDYYKATLTNHTKNAIIVIFRSDGKEDRKFLLQPEKELVCSYTRSDVIDIYNKINSHIDNSSFIVKVDNYQYMGQLKTVVKVLLFFSVCFISTMVGYVYWGKHPFILQKILYIGAALCLSMAYVVVYFQFYPYLYIAAEYLTILFSACAAFIHWPCFSERESIRNSTAPYLICGMLGMGCIYMIYSQMLNATHGLITYFSAYNDRAVMSYVLMTLLLLLLVAVFGKLFAKEKNGFISFLYRFLANPSFLYSTLFIEAVLLLPLTSWSLPMKPVIGGTLLVVLGVSIVIAFKIRQQNRETEKVINKQKNEIIVYIVEIALFGMIVINNVQINYWGNDWSDVYHCNWYYGTLYDIGSNLPFPGGLDELYGHFALFYKPFLLLFGNSLMTVGMVTAAAMLILLIGYQRLVHKYIRSNFLRILFFICIFASYSKKIAYPMNLPHRILFPVLLLNFISRNEKKQITWKNVLGGYGLCLLANLWSTDSGLVCSIVYFSFLAIRWSETKNYRIFAFLRNFMIQLPLLPVIIMADYGIVQAYNYVVTGYWSDNYTLTSYLSAIVNKAYMSQGQFNTFYFENSIWMYFWILFAGFLIYGLYGTGILANYSKACDNTVIMPMCIASLGLGYMTIIISRPEDYTLVIGFGLLLSFLFLERYLWSGFIKENGEIQKNAAIITLYAVLFLISNLLLMVPGAVKQIDINLKTNDRWNYHTVKEGEKQLQKYPEDEIYAVGNGIKMLYFDMNRILENGNGGLAPEGKGEVQKMVDETKKNYILTDLDLILPDYEPVDTIWISNFSYVLYERKKE